MARTLPFLFLTSHRGAISCLLLTTFLCSISYFIGFYQNSKIIFIADPYSGPNCLHPNLSTSQHPSVILDFESHHTASLAPSSNFDLKPIEFCPKNFTDYCPCQDPVRERRFEMSQMLHRERHCPEGDERVRCLIPRPEGYRTPFPWPKSREFAWFANVPSKRLTESKKKQNWVRLEGDRLVFPGGGTSFPSGVKGYVDQIAQIVPLRTGDVRTVLDIGCGVSGFGVLFSVFDLLILVWGVFGCCWKFNMYAEWMVMVYLSLHCLFWGYSLILGWMLFALLFIFHPKPKLSNCFGLRWKSIDS